LDILLIKKTQLNENIYVQEFHDYFKNLSDSINTTTHPDSEFYCDNQFCYADSIFADLDSVITTDEVRDVNKVFEMRQGRRER
jgi:hypothetical protein